MTVGRTVTGTFDPAPRSAVAPARMPAASAEEGTRDRWFTGPPGRVPIGYGMDVGVAGVETDGVGPAALAPDGGGAHPRTEQGAFLDGPAGEGAPPPAGAGWAPPQTHAPTSGALGR